MVSCDDTLPSLDTLPVVKSDFVRQLYYLGASPTHHATQTVVNSYICFPSPLGVGQYLDCH